VLIVLLTLAIANRKPLTSGVSTLQAWVERILKENPNGNDLVSPLAAVLEELFQASPVQHQQVSKAGLERSRLSTLTPQLNGERLCKSCTIGIDKYQVSSQLFNHQESLLFKAINQIRNSLEVDTILETSVQSIRNLLQTDRCQFLWYRPHEIAPYWEVVNEARNLHLTSQIGQYTTEQVEPFVDRLLNQQIIQIDAVETCRDSALRQVLLTLGYTSNISIVIKTQSGGIGVISCGDCTEPRLWDQQEVELLKLVTAQLAIAIDHAEVYTQIRQDALTAQARSQQLELLLQQLQATQTQLVQSAKMSSLSQLVAGVAHEINNPVNFIHGNLTYANAYISDLQSLLQLYQQHYPNPAEAIVEQAQLIDIDFIADDLPKIFRSMQLGTDRIRSIVRSLQNFSRLDEAPMKSVDLHEGINSTLLILQHRLKPQGRKPEIQIFQEFSNLPLVECYPGQLNQVFVNILSNAIEALDRSTVETQGQHSPALTIRTSLVDSSNSTQDSLALLTRQHRYSGSTEAPTLQNSQHVVIQITDNGSGMTESVKAQLFDPFFTTKPVGQGLGLGLSISYQIIVEHHHGALTCTSTLGQGTEFRIEIPIRHNPNQQTRVAIKHEVDGHN
jgi:signal transduction histidine kinase